MIYVLFVGSINSYFVGIFVFAASNQIIVNAVKICAELKFHARHANHALLLALINDLVIFVEPEK